MRESVIVSAVRTPTGKFLGGLKDFTAPELGAIAVREAVRRAGIDPAIVDECIMGNVVAAPAKARIPRARPRSTAASPITSPRMTINKVCGSGLKAVMLAAQGIATGDIDIAVAGGMESMSNSPYLLPRVREGLRMGNGTLVDSMIHDGLWCAFEQCHMGMSGEHVAEHVQGRRASEQDDYAAEAIARRRTRRARAGSSDEIRAGRDPAEEGAPRRLDHDEAVRADTTTEALAGLKPAFKKDGTVTAGNAPGVNDGAAALVVMAAEKARALGLTPLARIVGQATRGWRRSWC